MKERRCFREKNENKGKIGKIITRTCKMKL